MKNNLLKTTVFILAVMFLSTVLKAQSWRKIDGKLMQISVGNKNNVWGVNAANVLYRWENNGWKRVATDKKLKCIAVGSASNIWALDANGVALVYNTSNKKFESAGTDKWQFAQIAVGADGDVWAIKQSGNVYHFIENAWIEPEPKARITCISVGDAYHIWGVNAEGMVYNIVNGKWKKPDPIARLKCISASSDGQVWGVNPANLIYKLD